MLNNDVEYFVAYVVNYTSLSYKEVLKMSPVEVQPFLYTKDKIVFEEYKRQADLARLQTFYLVSAQVDLKKAGIRKPSDLISYSWDKLPKVSINLEEYSPEVFDALDAKFCK